MFSNLMFLVLALLLVSIAGELQPSYWHTDPAGSFFLGLAIYIGFLGLIVLQNFCFRHSRKITKNPLHLLANIELLAFLSIYHFILGGQRLLNDLPFIGKIQFIPAIFSLTLYFLGLIIFHFSYSKIHFAPSPSRQALNQIRLTLPFAIPFLLFTLLFDIALNIPSESFHLLLATNENSVLGSLFLFLASLAFMGLMLVFLPPLVVYLWQCQPMEEGPLKQRLENLCKKAHFKHGGILDWTILNQSLTAAIIGVLPRLRYVIFTKRLQHEMSPDAIEAILAHEIGHSYRKHLLLYPLIILGMIFCTGLFSLFFSEAITTWFNLHNERFPSVLWPMLYPLAFFIPYALIIGIYFRYVFGFFSRLFERQADLHGFELGIPPENMIKALDDVAIATGFTHRVPNWHHYSLHERITFLRTAIQDPRVIPAHHRRVKYTLALYMVSLVFVLWLLMASLFPEAPLLKETNEYLLTLSKKISDIINHITVGQEF